MDKTTAIKALCEIVSGVGALHFNHQYEHDCFCVDSDLKPGEPIISKEVIEFIREAVQEKMDNTVPSYELKELPNTVGEK